MHRIRPIIVLGAERSGTSAWAELIYRWGGYAGGGDELAEPDGPNPHGRWEYGPLWDLLALVGDFAAGVSWWEESFQDRVKAKAQDRNLRAAAEAMVAQMASHGRPWLWKDPALCHFLPFWRQIWRDPVYLIAVRHPLDVARSWQQFARGNGREPTSVRCNLLRWQYMTSLALAETANGRATLFVQYEQLAQQPEQQARRLASFLGTHCGATADTTVIARMAAACDPALWRNRSGYQHGTSHPTGEQADLYALLCAKAADVSAPIRPVAMPAGWRRIVMDAEAAAHF